MELTKEDWGIIQTSLYYSKRKIEEYPIANEYDKVHAGYPNYQYKLDRIKEIDAVINKVKQIQKGSIK